MASATPNPFNVFFLSSIHRTTFSKWPCEWRCGDYTPTGATEVCFGVDINRDFDTVDYLGVSNFGKGDEWVDTQCNMGVKFLGNDTSGVSSVDHDDDLSTPGLDIEPFTEPESIAIYNFIQSHPEVQRSLAIGGQVSTLDTFAG